MSATKTKLSFTVSNNLAHLLETVARDSKVPKSQLIEEALNLWHIQRLEEDAKKIASMQIDDPAIEQAWLDMDLNLLNEWEWKE